MSLSLGFSACSCIKSGNTFLFLFFLIYYLLMYWLHPVWVAAHGIVCWGVRFSLAVVRRLSCPAACGILVPQPGLEPASPALQDGFLTTGPPGKSPRNTFLTALLHHWSVSSVHILSGGTRIRLSHYYWCCLTRGWDGDIFLHCQGTFFPL